MLHNLIILVSLQLIVVPSKKILVFLEELDELTFLLQRPSTAKYNDYSIWAPRLMVKVVASPSACPESGLVVKSMFQSIQSLMLN
jgi:hypothetical protein